MSPFKPEEFPMWSVEQFESEGKKFCIVAQLVKLDMLIYEAVDEATFEAIQSYVSRADVPFSQVREFVDRLTQKPSLGTSTLLLCQRFSLPVTFHKEVREHFQGERLVFWEQKMGMSRDAAPKKDDKNVLKALKSLFEAHKTETRFVFLENDPARIATRLASATSTLVEVAVLEPCSDDEIAVILGSIQPDFTKSPFLQTFWERSHWTPIPRLGPGLYARNLKP